jgi:hypothetical protein
VWQFEELTKALTHAIRSVGYRYTIDISFPLKNSKVIAQSSSPLANFMRNPWTKVFSVLTCIGVVIYPAKELYKKVNNKVLKADFGMNITTREFYDREFWNIVNQVQYK